jgi:ABC-type phosphate transport system substrate-binding protein
LFYAWLIKTPNVTVKLCGSTTLGEKFAPHFIEAIAHDKGANTIKKLDNKDKNNITIDANFPNTKDKKDNPFQGLVRFIVDYGGTTDGIDKLTQNKCDMALASEKLKDGDPSENDFERVLLGRDAIAIIINDNNETRKNFQVQTIKSILEDKQYNNQKWQVFCRENSGTTDTIIEKLDIQLEQSSFLKNCNKVATNREMWDKVIRNKPSIGYLSYSFLVDESDSDKEKFLKTIDNQKPAILLSDYLVIKDADKRKDIDKLDDIYLINEKYKLNRELSFYIQKNFNSKQLKYIVSSVRKQALILGQKILKSEGFASISSSSIIVNRNQKYTETYTETRMKQIYDKIRQKGKSIYTEYFSTDDYIPANQKELIESLSNYNSDAQFVLIGHASPGGDPKYNLGLSIYRAEYIRNILYNKGYQKVYIYGFSDKYTLQDESKNARVEIYDLKIIQNIDQEINSPTNK